MGRVGTAGAQSGMVGLRRLRLPRADSHVLPKKASILPRLSNSSDPVLRSRSRRLQALFPSMPLTPRSARSYPFLLRQRLRVGLFFSVRTETPVLGRKANSEVQPPPVAHLLFHELSATKTDPYRHARCRLWLHGRLWVGSGLVCIFSVVVLLPISKNFLKSEATLLLFRFHLLN